MPPKRLFALVNATNQLKTGGRDPRRFCLGVQRDRIQRLVPIPSLKAGLKNPPTFDLRKRFDLRNQIGPF
jgi:hypothetical protein